MRFFRTLLTVLVCSSAVFAPAISAQNQTAAPSPQASPAPDQTTPSDQTQPQDQAPSPPPPVPGQLPPSPLEQQNEQVRQVDPLDREIEKKAKEKEAREAEKKRKEADTPLPGSIAASEQRAADAAGPQVEEDSDQGGPVQEYTGPAVLSRSYSLSQALIPEQLKWNESVSLNSVYNTGVSRTVNANGTEGPAVSMLGSSLAWSFGGRHYFHKDQISITYTGNYTRYPGSATGNVYTGMNQNIGVGYSHVISRRLTVNLMTSGLFTAENEGLQNPSPGPETVANINISSSPNIQIFDTGSRQISTQLSIVYQKSARLSFSAGISWFGIAQDSPLLLGMTGKQARGDVNYRLTRNTTVGTYYSFSEYVYPHGVGNSATTTSGLIYSYAFTRTMQLRFRGGVSITQSLGLVSVPVDPLIGELLGIQSGLIDSYQTLYGTDLSAQFIKDFRHGTTASISYAKGISPGNGVYQTSEQDTITATIAMKLARRYQLSFVLGRDTLEAATQAEVEDLGKYSSEYATLTTGKTFRRGIGFNVSAQFRHYDLNTGNFVRNQMMISSGLTWGSQGRLWPF